MDRRSFEAVVEEALARLPEEFQLRLDNVAVLVEDRPSRDLLRSMGIPPRETLLGVYQGTPLPDRGPTTYGNVLPDRVVLFQEPIEEMGGGPQAIRRRIADTVVHELGHYFGLSDEEMDDAEDALDVAFGPDPAAVYEARGGDDEEEEEDEDDLDDEDLDDEELDEDEEDLEDDEFDEDEEEEEGLEEEEEEEEGIEEEEEEEEEGLDEDEEDLEDDEFDEDEDDLDEDEDDLDEDEEDLKDDEDLKDEEETTPSRRRR